MSDTVEELIAKLRRPLFGDEPKWYRQAIEDHTRTPGRLNKPGYCNRCGNFINDFFDDCGFFYVKDRGEYEALCEPCWNKGGYNTCER